MAYSKTKIHGDTDVAGSFTVNGLDIRSAVIGDIKTSIMSPYSKLFDFNPADVNTTTDTITITDVNVTYKTEVLSYSTPVQLGNGERSGTIALGTFSSPDNEGTSYTLTVNIAYTDDQTGFEYSDSGTLTGTVQ